MRCAVLGSPIAHSLSPVMHRAAYAALELDWTYDAHEVPAHHLAAFVALLGDDVHGLSVTAPLKREAAELATRRSDVVERLGVANTLVRSDGGWTADNTDVPGLLAALDERGVPRPRSVRVLGGGATAASAVHALCSAGAHRVEVLVRDAARAAPTVQVARATGIDVVVSSLDTAPAEPVDLLVSTIPSEAVAAQVDQWVASAAGLDLLAHQAVLQVLAMTGQVVDVDVLRRAALAALGQ